MGRSGPSHERVGHMRGVRPRARLRQSWSLPVCAVAILLLAAGTGCGGDRRSGTASVDTTAKTALDTSSSRAGDTAPVTAPESTAGPVRDTVPASQPSMARQSETKKPAPPKPRTPTAKPAVKDTAGAETAAGSQKPESTQASSAQQDPSAPLRDPYHPAPIDTVSQVVYDGWKQYNLNCARCHGEDVQGTTIAPHLIVSLKPDGPINTKELFVQTVCAGRPEKGMPAWCALGMEMDKINSMYDYVKGRSEGKIHPGRPAVRQQG